MFNHLHTILMFMQPEVPYSLIGNFSTRDRHWLGLSLMCTIGAVLMRTLPDFVSTKYVCLSQTHLLLLSLCSGNGQVFFALVAFGQIIVQIELDICYPGQLCRYR